MWKWLIGCAASVVLLLCPMEQAKAGIIYNLASNWSDTTNPNGVWSYNDGGGPILYHHANYYPGYYATTQPAWAYAASGAGHIVSWFRSLNTIYDFQPGDVITHTWDSASSGYLSGYSTPHSNVSWTSPTAGTIDISGSVWLARDWGRAVDWSLEVNGFMVTGGSLFSGDPYSRAAPFNLAAGSGGAGVLNDVPVLPGDKVALFFKTTSTYGEFTGVNFQIELTPVPEPSAGALFGLGMLGLAWWARRRRINLNPLAGLASQ